MKRIYRKIIPALLAAVILAIPASAEELPFTDVPESAWYYADVAAAYESGLINGKSATTFAPNAYLTYAEAVKLAACMNQLISQGEVTLENGDPWYQSYVDYLADGGLLPGEYNWNSLATRAGYMEIFSAALPDSSLRQINSVPRGSIPDVPADHPSADAIYRLYRAGILQGSDPITHSANPDSSIRRSEVSALIARIIDEDKRISFFMGEEPEFEVTDMPVSFFAEVEDGVALFTVTATGENVTYLWQKYDFAEGVWADLDCTEDQLLVEFSFTQEDEIPIYRCVLSDGESSIITSEVSVYPPVVKVEITSFPTDSRSVVSLLLEYTSMSLSEAKALVEGEAPVVAVIKGGAAVGLEMAELTAELGGEAVVHIESAIGLKYVRLTSVGEDKIGVIKLIDKYADCGLTEAQSLVKQRYPVIGRAMSRDAAARFVSELESVGATAVIKE